MTSRFGEDRFMAIESSATSASNLEWYVRELAGTGDRASDDFTACNDRAEDVVPAADDPFFHPYLHGSRLDARMRAGFYGVGHWHGEAHLTRAVFEGVAFEHRRHVDVLRSTGMPFNRAILSGGGARSSLWPQMFADVLGIPISLAACAETGALGAAIAAGVGVGAYADLADGVRIATRERRRVAPNPDMTRHYGERYETFLMLAEAMKPVWSRLDAANGSP
jgi:L-xylulokinase